MASKRRAAVGLAIAMSVGAMSVGVGAAAALAGRGRFSEVPAPGAAMPRGVGEQDLADQTGESGPADQTTGPSDQAGE